MVLETTAQRRHLGPRELGEEAACAAAGAVARRAPHGRPHARHRPDPAQRRPPPRPRSPRPARGRGHAQPRRTDGRERRVGELVACEPPARRVLGNDLAFVESDAEPADGRGRARAGLPEGRRSGVATQREEQLNDAQRLARMGSWDTDSRRTHTLSENLREMLACVCTDGTFIAMMTIASGCRSSMATAPEAHASRHRAPRTAGPDLRVGFRGVVSPTGSAEWSRTSRSSARRSSTCCARRNAFARASTTHRSRCRSSTRVTCPGQRCVLHHGRSDPRLELTADDLSHREAKSRAGRYPRPDPAPRRTCHARSWSPTAPSNAPFGQVVDITERKAREASLKAQLDEIAGLGEIRRAFEEDRFEMHAQPIIDLATGETRRARAAASACAVEHGAIRDIDRWVIAQGAALAARGIDVEINIGRFYFHTLGHRGTLQCNTGGRRSVAARVRHHGDRVDRGTGSRSRAAAHARGADSRRRLRQRLRRLSLPQAPAQVCEIVREACRRASPTST